MSAETDQFACAAGGRKSGKKSDRFPQGDHFHTARVTQSLAGGISKPRVERHSCAAHQQRLRAVTGRSSFHWSHEPAVFSETRRTAARVSTKIDLTTPLRPA